MNYKLVIWYALGLVALNTLAMTPLIWGLFVILVVLDLCMSGLMYIVCDYSCRRNWERYLKNRQHEIRALGIFSILAGLYYFKSHWYFLGLVLIVVHVGWLNLCTRLAKSYIRDEG